MTISKKDQSFILLIVSVLVVLYSIYSLFSYLFFNATFSSSDAAKIVVQEDSKSHSWYNLSRSLKVSDLKNRVILLNFYDFGCSKCAYSLLETKRLEQKHGSNLTVIGVHSKKMADEESKKHLLKFILKNKITYPVYNDVNLTVKNNFDAQIGYMILIDPQGQTYRTYKSAQEISNIDEDIEHLSLKYKYKLNHAPLPFFSEENSIANNVLSFPTKIKYVRNFEHQSRKVPALFIANSGNNNIVVSSLLGEIMIKIGNKIGGFEDGDFETASFNFPSALLYRNNNLYVIDNGNNALRKIDFANKKVSTLIGSGLRGELISGKIDASEVDLSNPKDLEFFPDKNHIVIADASTRQILTYSIKNKTVEPLVNETSSDETSQISDIVAHEGKLYVLDSGLDLLQVVDKKGNIKTLIDGKKSGKLKNPMGLTIDDTGVYITDASKNAVKKYSFSSKKLSNFLSDKKLKNSLLQFDEPNAIIPVLNRFYISDTNNNRIISIDRTEVKPSLLNVMPPLKLSQEGFLQYLPNLQKFDQISVSAEEEILVDIDIKKGWKLNEKGPSFINLLELTGDNKANLLASFDWNAILDRNIRISKLTSGKEYTLQGVIYYCEDKADALCYVKSYEQKIKADKKEKSKKVVVQLDY